jgi:hypothetical protein
MRHDAFLFTSAKPAAAGGLSRLQLVKKSRGVDIEVRGKGTSVVPPSMPLTATVRVQLTNSETGACWEAVYTKPSKSSGTIFEAISD